MPRGAQVYNFDAREKVRKDEEAAAAAEAAVSERALAAERAYRHGALLERAAKRRRGDAEGGAEGGAAAEEGEDGCAGAAGALALREAPPAHVNLFEDFEARARATPQRRSAAAAQLQRSPRAAPR